MRAKAAPIPADAPVTSASLRSMKRLAATLCAETRPRPRAFKEKRRLCGALKRPRIERGLEWVYRARRVTAWGRPRGQSVRSRRCWMADPAVGVRDAPEETHHSPPSEGFYALALGAMGVVF